MDNLVLKDPVVTQILTRLIELFVFLSFLRVFRVHGGSHLDSLKSRSYLPTRARTGKGVTRSGDKNSDDAGEVRRSTPNEISKQRYERHYNVK